LPDLLQRSIAAATLVGLAPMLLLIAVGIRLGSVGPAFFPARRIGRRGVPFIAWKFRTMTWRPESSGPAISSAGDPRVTPVGRLLRRFRLDELPQLWNVARAEMRLVGPRPEDPRFVELADPRQREVLSVRPGITGLAQLAFADEARVLGPVDPEGAYRRIVQPRKLRVDAAYVRHRSTRLDLWILGATALVVLGRPAPLEAIDRLVGDDGWRLPADPPAEPAT
jgi:lipopolysaccharide/colanic/teichoic acid biosynthesis glycosyltransferase